MFHSIQYRNEWLAASDLIDMFTQSIKFDTFHYQYSLRARDGFIQPIFNKMFDCFSF